MMENSYAEQCRDFDENYRQIREQIGEAAQRSGRTTQDVTLLAATKTVPAEVINHAIAAGLSCIGENRVQELLEKYDRLDTARCDVQFIGNLQPNKIKYIVDKVSCIQSVYQEKQAAEISRLALQYGKKLRLLIEVNIGREPQKGGLLPEELPDFLKKISVLDGIQVCGLMTIPPICENREKLRLYFSAMHQSFVDIRAKSIDNIAMDCLSMGMSSDFAEAIECGATMVRVGTSLFGKRDYLK